MGPANKRELSEQASKQREVGGEEREGGGHGGRDSRGRKTTRRERNGLRVPRMLVLAFHSVLLDISNT